MIKYLPITPFVGAFILLACAKADPVVDNAVAPSDELLGDVGASGLAAPANAAAAEAAQQAALPPASGGLTWAYRESDGTALFGPQGAGAALTIQCRQSRDGKELVFTRFVPTNGGARGTLSFTGNGMAASLPVIGMASQTGPGGHWEAIVPRGDMARDVAKTFDGKANVQVAVGGSAPLSVPSVAEPRMAFADCLGD